MKQKSCCGCGCKPKPFRVVRALAVLAVLALTLWYGTLTERQKQSLRNFLRQIPDLPARYLV